MLYTPTNAYLTRNFLEITARKADHISMNLPFLFKKILNFSLITAMIFPFQAFAAPRNPAVILPYLREEALQRVAKHFGPKAFRTENILSLLQTRFPASEDTKYFWENRHKLKQEIVPTVRVENGKLVVQADEAPAISFSEINPLSQTMRVNERPFDPGKYKSLKAATEAFAEILEKTQPQKSGIYNFFIPDAQAIVAPVVIFMALLIGLPVGFGLLDLGIMGGLTYEDSKMESALASCRKRDPAFSAQMDKLNNGHHSLESMREIRDCAEWAKKNGLKTNITVNLLVHCQKGQELLHCMDRYKGGQPEPASEESSAPAPAPAPAPAANSAQEPK